MDTSGSSNLNIYNLLWAITFIAVFVWSAIAPKDYFTWSLEVAPAVMGAFVILITHNSYRLTPLIYILILIHCIILMVGGHYTYAEVPLFDDLRETFNHSRNHYDKVGHFAQGFVPAMIAREIAVRNRIFTHSGWRFFFIVCFCLAFSAFYELIEWWVALLTGEGADAFLGSQGYEWDTQSDMLFALIGAIFALISLRTLHDKQLKKVGF